MAAPSNFAAWLDMLRRLTRRNHATAWKDKELVKLCERLKARQTERNAVVHAVWHEPSGIGLAKTASGFGVPKRGLMVFLEIEKSSAQMRDIAKRIQEAEQELIEWWAKQQPMTGRGLVAQAMLGAQNPQPTTAKHQTQQTPSQGTVGQLLFPPAKK